MNATEIFNAHLEAYNAGQINYSHPRDGKYATPEALTAHLKAGNLSDILFISCMDAALSTGSLMGCAMLNYISPSPAKKVKAIFVKILRVKFNIA